jgi:hypothetical protein
MIGKTSSYTIKAKTNGAFHRNSIQTTPSKSTHPLHNIKKAFNYTSNEGNTAR